MPPRRAARDAERASDAPADEREEDQDEPEQDEGRDAGSGRGRRAGGAGRVTAAQAAREGMRSLVELIGKRPEGVTAVEPTEDGWLVGVEVVEDQRVPSSADILAVYEAELDPEGGLISYRRTARYARGRGDSVGDR